MVHGDLVFVSGQLAIDPKTGEKITGTIEEQTQRALENVAAIVKASGSDISNIIKATLYISNADMWGRVNDVFASFFGDHRPARAVVPSRNLPFGFDVEIEAIAILRAQTA
jgi:2-iminobutanoate/2-iminopropanoate deaminase